MLLTGARFFGKIRKEDAKQDAHNQRDEDPGGK